MNKNSAKPRSNTTKSKRSNTSKGNSNKSNVKKKVNTKKGRGRETKQYDIKGLVIIIIGLLLGVSIYTNLAGLLSEGAQNISQFLLGIGAYVIPIYILYLGYEYIKTKGNIILHKNFYGITLYILVIMFVCSSIYISGLAAPRFGGGLKGIAKINSLVNGGVVGYLVAFPMYKFIGFIGSAIIYIGLTLLASIIVFDISLYNMGKKIKDTKKNMDMRAREIKETDEFENGYINLVENGKNIEDKNSEKKKKLLEFMKNNSLHLEDTEKEDKVVKEAPKFVEPKGYENKRVEPRIHEPMIKEKKEKKTEPLKENVNKEIEKNILENSKDAEKKVYIKPPMDLLNENTQTQLNSSDKHDLIESANKLSDTLGSFGVDAKVTQVTKGPSVTRFELQPSPGVKVSKIVNLADDIALGLAASGVRIEAPIPGKAAVGIEVPNKKQTPVFLKEVLGDEDFLESKNKLAIALGKDIGGQCVIGDLSKMPHTLIAGATGSGKSVCINTLIISLLYKYSPDEVKLLMVDPKVVELSVYNGIPHLLIPVVTDPKKAAAALNWAVNEMTRRYKLFADSGARNIDSYNNMYSKGIIEEKLPFIVIIVDELADLMMVCANDIEDYIGRLAQMARAAGMHLVIATQRPSVDVITGVIKANIPSRISFAVSSQIDSRTILDSSGAEKLLGRGDMLYYPSGESKPLRVQGCFISEEEVEDIVNFVKNGAEGITYEEDIIEHINNETEGIENRENNEEVDELLNEAIEAVVEYKQASTSFIQRRLRVGFNRASRIMEELETRGIISAKDGSRPRQVLITKEDLLED